MNPKAAPDRILIVCDDTDMQTLFEVLGKGDQVVLISSAAEALRRLDQERFDLVIVDIDLPGMHCVEFFEGKNNTSNDTPSSIQGVCGG
jgi:CheY-like chemotaxis protein